MPFSYLIPERHGWTDRQTDGRKPKIFWGGAMHSLPATSLSAGDGDTHSLESSRDLRSLDATVTRA